MQRRIFAIRKPSMSTTRPINDASNRAGSILSSYSKKRPRAPDAASASASASAAAAATLRGSSSAPARAHRRSAPTQTNSKSLIAPRKHRLPPSILPGSGAVKVRFDPHIALLYDRPSGNRKVAIGEIRYGETKWRQYDSVHYDANRNQHFLCIRLTEEERGRAAAAASCAGTYTNSTTAAASASSPPPPTHGWARYENIAKPIPANKAVLEPRFVLKRKSVVLISLFDGIGGGRVAMDRLKNEYSIVATFSSEKDRTAKAVMKRYDPNVVELPNVEEIDHEVVHKMIFGNRWVREAMQCTSYGDELHFIVIAGPPCQDLSQANKNSHGLVKGALAGERSRLFFHVPRIVKMISDSILVGVWGCHYLVENVEMTERNRDIFTEFLDNAKPWKVDFTDGGACASLMSRRRLYFSSVMPQGGQIGFLDFDHSGCIHPARKEGKGVDDVLDTLGWGDWKFVNAPTGKLPTLTRRESQGGQNRYQIQNRERADEIRDAPQIINEDLLGFPRDHTKFGPDGRLLSEEERRLLLGNTFCSYHIQFLLKEMHHRICEPRMLAKYGGKYIQLLPQDICRYKLGKGDLSREKRKFYEEVLKVVTDPDMLHFDDYEKKIKGTLLKHWA